LPSLRYLTMDRPANKVDITIARAAVESIFDECDRYDADETGGRLIGTYRKRFGGRLSITVSGIIEPGPRARRSATSFFQDGEYQEAVFREIESQYSDIEHLGNWHTHHVNGYPTLSGGDRETYHRIVNHQNHNTHFFYALLVTARKSGRSGDRYSVKHFLIHRGDAAEYEIPHDKIRIVDSPIIWPRASGERRAQVSHDEVPNPVVRDQRAIDSEFFKQLYPGLRPYLSKTTGGVYWRGRISLVDLSEAEVVVAEVTESENSSYGVAVKGNAAKSPAAGAIEAQRFASAREAMVALERSLNIERYNDRIRG
jgi:hypothetical protein